MTQVKICGIKEKAHAVGASYAGHAHHEVRLLGGAGDHSDARGGRHVQPAAACR